MQHVRQAILFLSSAPWGTFNIRELTLTSGLLASLLTFGYYNNMNTWQGIFWPRKNMKENYGLKHMGFFQNQCPLKVSKEIAFLVQYFVIMLKLIYPD